MMTIFVNKSNNDARAIIYNSKQNYLEIIKSNSGRYKIEDAGINSKYSDYGTAIIGKESFYLI